MGQDADAPLSADAAQRLTNRLDELGIDGVFSSPFRRAIETVSPFATRLGIDIAIDDRLAERRLEATPSERWLDHLKRSFADEHYRAPGGETLSEAQLRGLQALADIAGNGFARPAVVTHGNLLASLLRSMEPAWGFEEWRALGNPALFDVRLEAGRPITFTTLAWP